MSDRDRRILTLPYGEGLERSKGIMVVRPSSFEDLRNVFLFDGKAQVRQGTSLASVLVDGSVVDLDVTVLLAPLRSEAAAMGIGYNTTGGLNREIWLNRLSVDGTSPIPVGLLGTLDGGATFDPPIIVGADSDNKFFIAHDEPNPTSRLVTQIYDPGGFPNLADLRGDLDGINGQQDIFFRGVVRHLSYIFGWGYGSFDDPVRGDVVRVSNSGNSAVFEDFAFFEVGQQGETVMVCRPAGQSLMVFKENETYEIFGYSPDTFGVRLADSLFGCVSSRLAVSVAGSVLFWSTQGPRITTGGTSQDIAVPLDIGGPDPSTLVAESEVQDAFAEYDPATRVVQFVWGQRVYALSIRDPTRPRWSYYELGEVAQCAGLFFATQSTAGGGGPPVGAPENLVFDEEARGVLTFNTGNALNNETVLINNKLYTWQTVLTDVDGNVQIGATDQLSADNLIAAVTLTGVPGTDYALSMTINSDMTAGPALPPLSPLLTVEASGRLADGFFGNGRPLETNMVNASWNTPVTKNGIGKSFINVGIKFDNIGQIGAEDIEVHVSNDGGANYTFCGLFPADGLFPAPQFINVTIENQSTGLAIQPLTDYKFSLRYRLGGLFSPGYDDIDPDVWDTPQFDSQGTTETLAGRIVLTTRVGDNNGLWEVLNSDDHKLTIPMVLPPGHELLDIEVFHFITEAGDTTDPDGFGAKPARGSVLLPLTLRTTINSGSPGYPNFFIDEYLEDQAVPVPQKEDLNSYQMRFVKGAKTGILSLVLPCFLGPDPPITDGITSLVVTRSFLLATVSVTWANAVTPTDPRVCPSTPPAGHSTHIYLRNVTTGGAWTLHETEPSFATNSFAVLTTVPISVGNTVRVAINHHVRCFGSFLPPSGRYHSDWAIENGVFYAETVVV